MTTAVLGSTDALLDALRGTAALRPPTDRSVAGGLRAWLEDALFERFGVLERGAIRVTTRSVTRAPDSASPRAVLRGALVGQLLRLRVAGAAVADPFEAAAACLRASGADHGLVEVLAELDAEDLARLAAEVSAHDAVLASSLPSLPSRWSPRCGVRYAVPLAGGGVVLRGTADLALGAPGGSRACVCLLDVTTSQLGGDTDATLSYLALLETLRVGEPPLRVAALSTASGESTVVDASPELLAAGVAAALDALAERP